MGEGERECACVCVSECVNGCVYVCVCVCSAFLLSSPACMALLLSCTDHHCMCCCTITATG